MPIGTPVSLGTNFANDTATNTITLSVAGILTGNLVVVAIYIQDSGQLTTVSTVSDGTNSYTKAAGTNDSTQNDFELWYKANATAVASGTLTVTFNQNTSGNGTGQIVGACRVANIQLLTPLDRTASGQSNFVNHVSVTTSPLTQGDAIAFGATCVLAGTSGVTYTQSSGFSSLNFNNTSIFALMGMDYDIVSSTAAVNYNPVWSTSGTSFIASIVATFKAKVTYITPSLEYPQDYQRIGVIGY